MELFIKLNDPDCIVSSSGKIFAFDNSNRHIRFGSMKERRQYLRGGYPTVSLNGKDVSVHRLVAKAFIGLCPDGMTVDHIDRNRLNNNKDNLRYATFKQQSDNQDRVYRSLEKYGVRRCDDQKAYSAKRYSLNKESINVTQKSYYKKMKEKGFFHTNRNGKSVWLPLSEKNKAINKGG